MRLLKVHLKVWPLLFVTVTVSLAQFLHLSAEFCTNRLASSADGKVTAAWLAQCAWERPCSDKTWALTS